MGYTQYFHFRNEELNEYEFSEICDLVAELAVAWYHGGKHGDAYIADVREENKGGKFFSANDYFGLAELWKKQKYILLFPEDQSTETLVIDFPLEGAFNFVKTYRHSDFCPLVRAIYKGIEKMGFGKTTNDVYYEGIRKGDALLKRVAPYLFNPPLSEEEEDFLKKVSGWQIKTRKKSSIITISNPSWDWSVEVKDVKSFQDLCEKVCHIAEAFEPSYEVYLRLEGFCPSDRIGDILDSFYTLRDNLQSLSREFFDFLKIES